MSSIHTGTRVSICCQLQMVMIIEYDNNVSCLPIGIMTNFAEGNQKTFFGFSKEVTLNL